MQREHFSLFMDFVCDHLDNRREISILLAPLAAFAPNGQPRSFPPWGYCAADRAVALFRSASDWRAAEASLQVPALARFLERSRPASQLARCGVDRAKDRRRSGDRSNHDRDIHPRGARNPIGNAVRPSTAKSASASPITGANLNPWPLKPQATATFANLGWIPTTKCPSGDMVYMQ